MTTAVANNIHELTREEGLDLFEREAQRRLGISGEEFLERWDAGAYEDEDTPAVVGMALLLPLAR